MESGEGPTSEDAYLKTCPDCAERIQGAANVCRFCGYRFDRNPAAPERPSPTPVAPSDAATPQRPRRRTRWPLTLAIGLILLIGAGVTLYAVLTSEDNCVSSLSGRPISCDVSSAVPEGEYEPSSSAATGDGSEENGESDSSNGGPSPQRYRDVGQAGSDGDLTFRVTAISEASSLDTARFSGGPVVPKEGASLVRADVEILNDGKTNSDPFCGQDGAVALDAGDRNYRLSPKFLDVEGNGWICLNGIDPGFERTAILPFQVPADKRVVGIALWDTEERGDLLGNKSYLVFER